MNFLSPVCWNSPHSNISLPSLSLIVYPGFVVLSYKIKGLRVTIPDPRGRISLPQIASSTEDFPADCEPTTTICGKSIVCLSVERVAKTSYKLLIIGISVSAIDITERGE